MSLTDKPIKSPNGYQQVSIHPPEDPGKTFYSPNWCDPSTWYMNAVRVVDQVLSEDVPLTVYKIPSWTSKMHMVDTYHAKITGEDFLVDGDGYSYRAVVKVNDVVKAEQNPHLGSGGDYTIDYDAGKVTFLNPLQAGDEVKMTYHKVDRTAGDGSASEWIIKPAAGRILEVVKVEVQFSADVGLADTTVFQPYVGGGPYGNPINYKSMWDFYNSANGCYPVMPALGGAGWRGALGPVYALPWMYQSVTALNSSYLSEIRICLEHDEPHTGENATATFYCLSVEI